MLRCDKHATRTPGMRSSWMMTSSNSSDKRTPGTDAWLFDMWLQTRLQGLYDETLDEAVPDDLLQLLPEPGQRCDH